MPAPLGPHEPAPDDSLQLNKVIDFRERLFMEAEMIEGPAFLCSCRTLLALSQALIVVVQLLAQLDEGALVAVRLLHSVFRRHPPEGRSTRENCGFICLHRSRSGVLGPDAPEVSLRFVPLRSAVLAAEAELILPRNVHQVSFASALEARGLSTCGCTLATACITHI